MAIQDILSGGDIILSHACPRDQGYFKGYSPWLHQGNDVNVLTPYNKLGTDFFLLRCMSPIDAEVSSSTLSELDLPIWT